MSVVSTGAVAHFFSFHIGVILESRMTRLVDLTSAREIVKSDDERFNGVRRE